jgi:three-Cys-motif partner protein
MLNKKKKKKEPYDRIRPILEYLTFADSYTKRIREILKNNNLWITNDDVSYGPHTLLKLAYLKYYFDIALEIAKRHFENYVFIDTLAGSGLVSIKDTEYVSLGSSLLALIFKSRSGTSFSKIIGVEIKENKFSLLYRRLNLIKKELNLATDIKLIKGDINEKIDDIANEINQRDYGILFVDPEGIEISLGDLSKILSRSKSIDVILNQSEGVYRLLGKAQNGDSVSLKSLEQYLPTLSNVQDLEKARNKLFTQFGKPIEATAEIRDVNNSPKYELVLRVRYTKSGAPWVKGMVEFANNITTKYNGKIVLNILDQIHGKGGRIDDFFKP